MKLQMPPYLHSLSLIVISSLLTGACSQHEESITSTHSAASNDFKKSNYSHLAEHLGKETMVGQAIELSLPEPACDSGPCYLSEDDNNNDSFIF